VQPTEAWRKRTPSVFGPDGPRQGASRGIGRSIAPAYVAEGARVVVSGPNVGALNTLVAELGHAAHAIPGEQSG
jgi:hypothetical protein